MVTEFRPLVVKIAVPAALVVGVIIASQRTGYAVPPPSDVNVVNTPSVNVANTPSVNVGNTPSVNVANTPSVNVATSPATALWTRDAELGKTSFQAHTIADFEPGTNGAFAAIAVPPGKRLVIENVSALAALNNDTALRYATVVTIDKAGGTEAEHYLVMTPQGSVPGIADYFSANHALRAYAIGNIVIRVFRTDSIGFGQVDVTITGTLVDAT